MNQHTHPDLIKLTEIEYELKRISPLIKSAQLLKSARAPYLISGDTLILTFAHTSPEDRDFYLNAPARIRYLLDFAWRAINHARETARRQTSADPSPPGQRNGDFAAECAMKCAELEFRAFLTARHRLSADPTDDDVRACVREALGIESRRQLNTDPSAMETWFQMRAAFHLWQRHR